MLLFYLALLLLLITLAAGYVTALSPAPDAMLQKLIFNLFFQIGAAALILKTVPLNRIGLHRRWAPKKTLIVYCALLAVTALISSLCQSFNAGQRVSTAVRLIMELNGWSLWLLLVQALVLAPFCEELVFRGFIFNLLRRRFSFLPAAAIASLAFSCLHFEPLFAPALFLIGLGLCALYEETGNLLNPVILHMTFNGIHIAIALSLKQLLS